MRFKEQDGPRTDKPILARALDWVKEGRTVALATVLQTWGSAPAPAGSQLAIDGEGNFAGSVSGGCVEGAVIAEAAEAMASVKPKTLRVQRRRRDRLGGGSRLRRHNPHLCRAAGAGA